MDERTTCVIIGGGPAGMVLGLLLARAGAEVTVLEKHADFLRDFRGDTVHPSTLELLDELGLAQRFAALPYSRVEEVVFPVGAGDSVVVADFRRLRVRHPYVALVPQWDLLNLLAEAAGEEPSFTLRMRTEATELIRESGRVRGVRYRTQDGTTGAIRAELTVACDGRWSIAHAEPDLPLREFPVPIDAWWFRLPRLPGDRPDALTPRAAEGRFAVVIPRTDFLQIAYIGRKGTDPQLRARGIERFREDVAELMPEFRQRVGALASMEDVKHLDVRLNRLVRWHVPGLLCIGDAAHAMSPVGGVGINLAVQDAVAAATLLAEPLRRGAVGPSEPAAVRARRLLPTVLVQVLQRLLHRGLVASIVEGRRMGPPAPVLALLRRVPQVSFVPAYLIGVGLRPEHAPDFARRPGVQPIGFQLPRRSPFPRLGVRGRLPFHHLSGVSSDVEAAMSLAQDVETARQALDAFEQACVPITKHFGDTVDARRLRGDVSRVRDDLTLLCGAQPRVAAEPFAGSYGDGDDDGWGGAGRTGR
jgi:2-polyprenyl-6-methoxyphenol hydroxylase-like FAD-dependent oxidoreductase